MLKHQNDMRTHRRAALAHERMRVEEITALSTDIAATLDEECAVRETLKRDLAQAQSDKGRAITELKAFTEDNQVGFGGRVEMVHDTEYIGE